MEFGSFRMFVSEYMETALMLFERVLAFTKSSTPSLVPASYV